MAGHRVDVPYRTLQRMALKVRMGATRLCDRLQYTFALVYRERVRADPSRTIGAGGAVAQRHDFFHGVAKQEFGLPRFNGRTGQSYLRGWPVGLF